MSKYLKELPQNLIIQDYISPSAIIVSFLDIQLKSINRYNETSPIDFKHFFNN